MNKDRKIIMLEDDLDFCKAIGDLLLMNNSFSIDKTFQSCHQFLNALEAEDWNQIDIFWIDLNLPDGSAIPVIPNIKVKYPNTKCLVCTFQSDDTNLYNALKFGADGYVLKDTDINTFIQTLNDIITEGAAMSPSIAKKIIQTYRTEKISALEQMTKREQEVLGLLAKGLLYKEISSHLHISNETTKKHISNIYQKLHVHNRTEAVLKLLSK